MTALYTVTMTTGATVTAVAVVPLAQALGSPSAAVGAIGFLAVAAFLGFLPVVLHAHRHSVRAAAAHISPWPLLRTRKGQLLTAIFTLQALLAYSLHQLVPLNADHHGRQRGGQRPAVRADAAGLRAGRHGDHRHRLPAPDAPAGLVSGQHHHGWPGWRRCCSCPSAWPSSPLSCSGFGLGIFPLVMVMISRSGTSTAETTALSTLAQSTGYLLATAGPFGTGLLYGATGSWTLPVALLLGLAVVQVVVAHLISRTPIASPEKVGPP